MRAAYRGVCRVADVTFVIQKLGVAPSAYGYSGLY